MEAQPPVQSPVDGPTARLPGDAINVMRYGDALGWDLPVFVEKDLFGEEFFGHDERVASMYWGLGVAMDKAFATTAADDSVLRFKYWRHVSPKATKMKPLELRAELFMNPDYGIVWCLVSRD